MNKAKKEESDLEIRKEMERRVLQDRPIRFDWVIKRLLYRKANFNVLNGFAVLAGLLAILFLVRRRMRFRISPTRVRMVGSIRLWRITICGMRICPAKEI